MRVGAGSERGRGSYLLPAVLLSVLLIAGCSSPAAQTAVAEAPTSTAASADPSPSAAPQPAATTTTEPSPEPVATVLAAVAAPAAAPVILGRIEIKRLGINLPIAEGDIERDVERAQTPEHYAFHLPGSSMFGPGNTYIYAHARIGMFLSLWNARVGDVVVVRRASGPREYFVAEIHPRVPPSEISWAQQTQDTRLTLQTSTGPNGSDPRFVVVARPK